MPEFFSWILKERGKRRGAWEKGGGNGSKSFVSLVWHWLNYDLFENIFHNSLMFVFATMHAFDRVKHNENKLKRSRGGIGNGIEGRLMDR